MRFFHEVRGCSLAVDIVARELGIPLRIEWVDMKTKTLADGTDYHAVNSKGTVPTLELPDGQFLSEGSVITQYLADQRPAAGLLAAGGTLKRYRTLEWMSFIAADLHKGGFMPLFKAITPPAYKDLARSYVRAKLDWLDSQLADRTFLMGTSFTIADAHCYTIAMWAPVHGLALETWPHLHAYLQRVGERPSVVAAEADAREQGEKVRTAQATPTTH